MSTMIVKTMFMRNAAIGLAMLAVCSAAQPSVKEYHLDSSGVVTIGDGIQLDLRSYPKEWKGRSAMSVGHVPPDSQTLTAHWELQHEKKSYGDGFSTLRQIDKKRTELISVRFCYKSITYCSCGELIIIWGLVPGTPWGTGWPSRPNSQFQ